DGTVYLLVSDEQSIVRWSSAEQRYLASIPLTGAPEIMTYSEHHNALFLGYAGGKITELNLDDTLQEENFANAVGSFLALEPAGEFIFACTPTQGTYTEYWAAKRETFPTRYFTFDYGEYTDTFRWSPAHRRMYHLRDLTTPNDLFGLPIDVNG